ncbi:hypothetical protein Tco_0787473 [Tanacetum coccineum]
MTEVTTDTAWRYKINILPPKTAEEIVARERERRARTTLLMAIPEDHLAKFHKMTDAKEIWNAIKSRFGGNDKPKNAEVHLKQRIEDSLCPTQMGFTTCQCYNCHKKGQFARESRTNGRNRRRDGWNTGNRDGNRTGKKEESKALVTVDGERIDWTTHSKDDDDYALMANNNSGSDITVMKNETSQSVFNTKDSDFENLPLYKQLYKSCEMQAVPPPMTGNYMPSGPDIEIDDSQYTYGPEKTQPSETESQTTELDICASNISTEISELVFSHLIRDCDYHVKLAKQVELHKQNMSKGNGSREKTNKNLRKPIWDNTQRVNKQHQFVTLAVQTRTGNNPVNTVKASGTNYVSTARQNINKQTVLTSTALKVNTVKPSVNDVRPQNAFNKTHSLSSRPLKGTTVLRTKLTNQKIYIAKENPHRTLKNKGIIDSGCSRHMTGNKTYLADYQDINGGPVAFGGSRGYITGKGKIQTGKLDFEDVSFVKELQHFNLFSVSQMCDKMNKVLFTDTECLILSPDFKLPDENQILLKVPRQNNMYSFNLENIVPLGGLACLIAKATFDESNLWHRRLGHESNTKLLVRPS